MRACVSVLNYFPLRDEMIDLFVCIVSFCLYLCLYCAIFLCCYRLCLCLLDLSAAFDTIDHDILITRLSSWFGIHGSVLSWFKSYPSSRPFRVKCVTDLSSWHTSSCGVPQGSVLGPLLFVMYTTPLSTLISSCSLNHHLYADDTRPALSILPSDSLRLQHRSPSQCSRSNFVLDDCKSSYT